MSVKITFGGRVFDIPPMPLICLERAWPHIEQLSAMPMDRFPSTTFRRVRESIEVLAAGMSLMERAPTADDIANEIKFDRFPEVCNAAADLIRDSGLVAKDEVSGELPAAQ